MILNGDCKEEFEEMIEQIREQHERDLDSLIWFLESRIKIDEAVQKP